MISRCHRPFMKGSEVSREADTLMGLEGAVATVFPSGVNSTVDVTSRSDKTYSGFRMLLIYRNTI